MERKKSKNDMSIAIIGGGITGLTTALALQKLNIQCIVFEKSPQMAETGAGILLQPNAMKILDGLAVGDKVRQAGKHQKEIAFTGKDLIRVRSSKSFMQASTADDIISIHRGRLHKVLYDSLPEGTVVLNEAYQYHETRKDEVVIQLSNRRHTSQLLLGADGINSEVRKQIFPSSALRYSGQTSWRGIARIKLKDDNSSVREALGDGLRFGLTAISADEVYWFAVANSEEKLRDNLATLKDDLLKMFRNFAPLVSEVIEATPPDKIIRTDISDLQRLNSWYSARTCLIGDAAHATTPSMGQGAGQGIEDAYYISNLLSRHSDHAVVFSLFEKMRRAKVDYVVNSSWRFGKVAQHPFGQQLMKLGFRYMPQVLMRQQMKRLHSVKEF